MAGNIFGIGVSALNAAQVGLATTEHNIANANTAGYSRQVIVSAAREAYSVGSGFIGQGVDVSTIKRVYDDFLSGQIIGEQGQAAYLGSYYTQIQQINNMLSDPNAGMAPALQDFFSAVNGVSNAPESAAARQAMLSSAQSLASRFQSMNKRLTDIGDSINGQISASVTSINSYAQQIAAFNHNVVVAQAAANGRPANDLLDQRDQLIAQLSQEINVAVVKQDDGSLNVSIGNGQMLVVGEQAYGLQAARSLSDPTRLEVAGGTAGGAVIRLQQDAFRGGKLGGLVAFRSQSLDTAQNTLGLVAMGVAGTFNQQHQLGQDLYGALGGNFFVQPVPVVSNYTNATGTAVIGAAVSSYAALTGSDYSLKYNGAAGYTLTRLSDNTVTNYAALPQTVDGLTIGVASGLPDAGDSFLIRPTANGAATIAVAITDPSRIAAAAPIRTNAALTNIGTGKASLGTVNPPPPVNANLQQPVSIAFNTPPTTFNVTGVGTGNPVNVPYTAGSDITYNGWTIQISGTPAANDTFTVVSNTNAPADNRNALLLAGLQNQKTLAGGTLSYQGEYSQLVSMVGNKTRELQVSSAAQDTLLAQTVQAQQAVSGVNLDEEAANLMRYQRAYQAAGKAMQIANSLFDTLLSLGR